MTPAPDRGGVVARRRGEQEPGVRVLSIAAGLAGALIFGACPLLLVPVNAFFEHLLFPTVHNPWWFTPFSMLVIALSGLREGWSKGVGAVTAGAGWVRAGGHHRVLAAAARGLTAVAVAVAGPGRAWRAEEFLADLACFPGSRASWALVRHATGLVGAGARMRAGDLRGLVDWTLARPRTEALSVIAAIAAAAYFLTAGGLSALLVNLQNVGSAAGLIYVPGLWLRNHWHVPPVPPRQHDNHPGNRDERS